MVASRPQRGSTRRKPSVWPAAKSTRRTDATRYKKAGLIGECSSGGDLTARRGSRIHGVREQTSQRGLWNPSRSATTRRNQATAHRDSAPSTKQSDTPGGRVHPRRRAAVAYGVPADGFFFAKSPAFTTLILFQSRRRRRAVTMSW